jgi:integrase
MLENFAKQLTANHGALVYREVFVVLRAYFNWDLENEKCLFRMPISQGLRKSITDNRKRAQRKKGRTHINVADMQKIFALAKGRDDEIVYHFLSYGLRIGEALGVRVKDVDLAKGKLFVNNQIQTTPKKMNGRGDWARTSDLSVPNAARYQLRHAPIL